MLDKPIGDILYTDIEELVQEKWPEGVTLDYKRTTYGSGDKDKRELLKDVAAFANTRGDIILGVAEGPDGLPASISGISVANVDAEIRRLDEILGHGLEPPAVVGIRPVYPPSGGPPVLILRVPESLVFPHRVVYRGENGEFWTRGSNANQAMNTDQLRQAFTLSATVYEQIRVFRDKRVAQVATGDTPIPMMGGGKLILHLVPTASFRSRQQFAVAAMGDLWQLFPPLGGGGNYRLNLDGYLTFNGGRPDRLCTSYTQFFRNGVVESVLADVVYSDDGQGRGSLGKGRWLRAAYSETKLMEKLPGFLDALKRVAVRPPIWGFLQPVAKPG